MRLGDMTAGKLTPQVCRQTRTELGEADDPEYTSRPLAPKELFRGSARAVGKLLLLSSGGPV